MTTFTWARNADGTWSLASNWSPSGPPAKGADVVIATTNFHTITHSSGSDTIGALSIGNDGLVVSNNSTLIADGVLTNGGTLTATGGGLLDLAGGGSAAAGRLQVAAGGTIELSGSAFSLTSGTVAGAGTLLLEGLLTLGASNVTLGAFDQSTGTVQGTGTLTLSGSTILDDAAQSGTGVTLLKGTSTIAGSGSYQYFTLYNGRVLENKGTVDWTGSEIYGGGFRFDTSNTGGTIKNDAGAVFDIQCDGDMANNAGTNRFLNAGVLEQTVAGGAYIGFTFTNTGTIVAEAGSLEFASGSFTNSGVILVDSSAKVAIDSNGSSSASAFTVASGGSVEFGDNFKFTGGTFDIAGTMVIESGGTVDFSAATIGSFGSKPTIYGGTLELGSNNVGITLLSMFAGDIDTTGTVTLNSAYFGNVHGYTGMTGSGRTLLTGTTNIAAYDLFVDGGRTLENLGTITWSGGNIFLGDHLGGVSVGGGTILNDAGKVLDIKSNNAISNHRGANIFINAGLLEKTAGTGISNFYVKVIDTGVITIASGTVDFAGVGNSFSGAIGGAGTVGFRGGSSTLASGTTLSVAALQVTGSAATLAIGEQLTYAGGLTQSNGTIGLDNDTLTLTGNAVFSGGTIDGSGSLLTKANTAVGGVTLGGQVSWSNSGTATETATMTLGNTAGTGSLLNLAAGTFDITRVAGITVTGAGGSVVNQGLFEKTAGGGIAKIAAPINNTGTIAVNNGVLELQAAISGSGLDVIAGGTLQFDGSVVATQSISFSSAGTLILNDPSGSGLSFAGSVTGFGSGDKIDLATFAYSGNPSLNWAQNVSQGTLTITDGSKIAKITLFGQYAAAGFSLETDGGTGTAIAYTPPPQPRTIAASMHH